MLDNILLQVGKLFILVNAALMCPLSSSLINVRFQKISIPTTRRVIVNSEGEGGLKSQNFKGRYEAKLEISGGWGVQTKISFHGGGGWVVWIFSGTT